MSIDAAQISHGESLWETLDVLRDKGYHGAKTCLAMASFLSERAAVENTYGEALIKAAKRAAKGATPGGGSAWGQSAAPLPSWAPSLVQEGWAGTVAAINSWGKQHVGWALCIDQNISKTLTQFSAKHKGHVARLWAEAQELVSDLEVVQGDYYRAKDAYEQACIQASRLLDERNKARDTAAAAAAQEAEMATPAADQAGRSRAGPPSPTKTKEAGGASMLSSVSKMLEKVGEGVAMAVSKASGDLSLTELEEKVPELLRNVDVAESEYIASIMAVNGYSTEFQPEVEEKLKQFQLLEEARIMHIREALLRLDQATKGMLECLLGPAGTLEALSIALSRINSLHDAQAHLGYVRMHSGMTPAGVLDDFATAVSGESGSVVDAAPHAGAGGTRPGCSAGEKALAALNEARHMTGNEVLGLPEDGVEKAFEGGRDEMTEAARIIQEMCCCLGEVVSVEENHTRDLLRVLERQGYGDRLAHSGVTGPRGNYDLHAIGATMEDVGKNVMANMSGSSTACAGFVAGEGKTLTKGWDSSAVSKALVCVGAHTGLARALADGSCSVAIKAHDEAKTSLKRATKLFSAGSKQLVAAKAAHAKVVARYDKICREVHEKEDNLSKARVDLNAELQAAGMAIIPGGPSPGVLESFGLGQQDSGSRVRALEQKLAAQVQEKDAAKQVLRDAIRGMDVALVELQHNAKTITLSFFTEDSSRHTGLGQLLDGVLSAFLETAKACADEQARADKSKATENIDGRKDVEEVVERNVHRVQAPDGVAARARGGHSDGVGEVMFMAYHSEVLQQERDRRRRSHLLSTVSGTLEAAAQSIGGDTAGVRRAGGGGHVYTAMAEAALAQAHAKQQARQILASKEDVRRGEYPSPKLGGPEAVLSSADAAAEATAACVTDGEGAVSTRSRNRRRRRRAPRAPGLRADCLSDSEVVICDSKASRHGGSLHGLLRRGSRHGSGQGSRHGVKPYSRHGGLKLLRHGSKNGRSGPIPSKRSKTNVKVAVVEKTDGADADSKGVAELVNDTGDQVQSNSGILRGTTEGISTPVPSPAYESTVDALVGGGVAAVAELGRDGETIIAVSEAGAQSSLPGRNAVLVKEKGMAAAASAEKDSQVLAVPSESSSDPRPRAATVVQSTVERVIEQDGAGSADEEVPIPLSPRTVAAGDVTRVDQEMAGDPEPAEEYAGVSGTDAAKTIHRSDDAVGLHAAVGSDAEAEGSVTARANETLATHQPYEHLATAEMRNAVEWESAPTEEEGRGGAVVPLVTFSPLIHDKQAQVASDDARGHKLPPHVKGRPSLRSLKHRLSHQEEFSSDGEEAESSSDELLSAQSAEFDTGGGVAVLYRDGDSSTGSRVVSEAAKQEAEHVSSLSAFDLPAEALQDKIIESYSCAVYSGGLPLHGRLYITAKYALFSGWRNTKVILPLSDVVGVEKRSTLRIVPNALTLVKSDGEKVTLGSFLFRDDCYTLLTRLVNVSSSISRLNGFSPPPLTGELWPASPDRGSFEVDDEPQHEDTPPEPSESSPGVAIPGALAASSRPGNGKFETMVDVVLPCTVAQGFAWLWGRGTNVWADFLHAQGEVGLDITRWCPRRQRSRGSAESGRGLLDLFPGETFDEQRELTFTHPRTGFVVGPKKVFTRQVQGYRLERRDSRSGVQGTPDVAPMDRVVLCQMTQMERGAPLADHFTILGRVAMVREPQHRDADEHEEPRCRLIIGFNVAFHKSTMLRGAIRSGAAEETKATWDAWLLASKKVVAYQRHILGHVSADDGVATAPPSSVFELARVFTTAGGGAVRVTEQVARNVDDKEEAQNRPISSFQGITGHGNLAVALVQALGLCAVATVKFLGVPNVLILLCLLMVAVQQREIQRLTGQVDDLIDAVDGLRDDRG